MSKIEKFDLSNLKLNYLKTYEKLIRPSFKSNQIFENQFIDIEFKANQTFCFFLTIIKWCLLSILV